VPRARKSRLVQLAAEAMRADSAQGLDRCTLSAWVAVVEIVREGLAAAGIDPARVGALRLIPPAASRQAADGAGALPLSEEIPEFTLGDEGGLADAFATKIAALARQYEDGREPDFAKASLAELFAWCISRRR
jgi:hypothetical protein